MRLRLKTLTSFSGSKIGLVLLLLYYYGSVERAEGKPQRRSTTCGPIVCKGGGGIADPKFHYKGGNTYSYLYTVNGTTKILGGPSAHSGLSLSAIVNLRFLTACDAILHMTSVSIMQSHLREEPDEGSEETPDPTFTLPTFRIPFIKAMEEHPLRFSYIDGLIEETCPHSNESSWVLNIKRGFLSAFQNTMRRLDLEYKGKETDIHGQCGVEYQIATSTSSSLTLLKTKDLDKCGSRFGGILSSTQGTPYNFANQHHSMPLVDASSTCNQEVDRNLLYSVECSELHLLKPLARGVNGAFVSLQQNLKLQTVYVSSFESEGKRGPNRTFSFGGGGLEDFYTGGETEWGGEEEEGVSVSSITTGYEEDAPWNTISKDSFSENDDADEPIYKLINLIPDPISRRESLLFKQDYSFGQTRSDYNKGKEALERFCNEIKNEVGEDAGLLMESLIYILRGVSPEDMAALSTDAATLCSGSREAFDDALEGVGTASSVAVMKERILRNEPSPARISSWIGSLNFMSRPDISVLKEAVSMLRVRDKYPSILLSFSNLAYAHCRHVGFNECVEELPVSILMRLYEKYFSLTDCQTERRKEVEQALVYLKGIGNFGLASNETLSALKTCLKNNENVEIRVAAIEAFRRMPCQSEEIVVPLKSLFENNTQDSEVRIAAFIGLMRCPTISTIKWIKRGLHEEQVNQVGSFVWSFLTNLQETALPAKAELQTLLADEELSTKFSQDFRKFSRNFEASTFYEDGNFGAALDGNIIFSENSYIPRSTSLNLTLDLFGESINLVEGKIRIENFEQHVESWFGPGSTPTDGKSKRQQQQQIQPESESGPGSRRGGRQRRSLLTKRKMRAMTQDYASMRRFYSDPVASLSLRVFGNEIYFKRLVGTAEQSEAALKLNVFKALSRSFDALKDKKDTNWQKSRLLLDSSYIIPTGVGFPLNLSAQASSIIRLESESLIDSSPNFSGLAFDVKGKLIPSALVTVAGSMTLSASDIHAGVKVRAHLRSSVALDGHLQMKSGELLNVEFGLPKSRLELLEYKSELMLMEGAEFRATSHVEKGQNTFCTGGLFYTYLGVKLCSSSYFNVKKGEEDSSSPYFPLNGPSYLTITLDKANPTLLKTRFHYGWNNNQSNTAFSLFTSSVTGVTKELAKERRLGLFFDMDKVRQKVETQILVPGYGLNANANLEEDWSSGRVNLDMKQKELSIFSVLGSFTTEIQSSSNSLVKPTLTIKRNNNIFMTANAELGVTKEALTHRRRFTGSGTVKYSGEESVVSGRDLQLKIDGTRNESHLGCNLEITTGRGEVVRCSLTTMNHHHSTQGSVGSKGGGEYHVSLYNSQTPHYNFATSLKYQSTEDGCMYEGEWIQGGNVVQNSLHSSMSTSPKLTPPSNSTSFYGLVGLHSTKNFEGSRNTGVMRVFYPSQSIDWSLIGNLTTRGKSLNSTVNFHYADGKTIGTSIQVNRVPGVLTNFHFGWNITLPSKTITQMSVLLEEKARRIYQMQVLAANLLYVERVILDIGVSDRSKRTKLDTDLSIGITTTNIENLKLGLHVLSEEKEAKLQLSSEYKGVQNALELGHNQVGRTGKKHKLVASVTLGDAVYLILSEVDLEHGLHFVLETMLPPKFSDIYTRISATSQNAGHLLGVEYRWDANRKTFLAETTLDQNRRWGKKLASIFSFPGYQCRTTLEYFLHEERKGGEVEGKMSWRMDGEEGHLHLNGHIGPRTGVKGGKEDDEAYDASLQLATPFSSIKNLSFALGLDFSEEGKVCQIKFNSSWKDDERMSGTFLGRIETLMEVGLDEEEEGETVEEEVEEQQESRGGDGDENFEQNEILETKKRLKKKSHARNLILHHNPFRYSFEGNISTTIGRLGVVSLKLNHVIHSYLNSRLDFDMQLPNEKEISVSSSWILPQRWKDLLSSRAELHIKTPFVGYQNVDLQTIFGRKEDRDVLALIGIYVENFQYAISITGTPRFEQDGALGFDVTTSNPKYDKIFGSFSYVFGDSTRLACQLGWPQVVVGLELGWEWVAWNDFQLYYIFTSTSLPLKSINALFRFDSSQLMELKLEANEDSIRSKCEWTMLSWKQHDVRLDGSTPFAFANKFGFLLKNNWEDEVTYNSQCTGWLNDGQVGYKLEGGKSFVEEEDGYATVVNSEFEIDTMVYPTIRNVFSLTIRGGAKFNLATSLTLREGPIDIEAQLELLDVYRFNENITVTTPYPSMTRLEVVLSPAIMITQGIYNLALETKWRSHSHWNKGGVFLRLGPQDVLSEVLTQEARDVAFLSGTDDEEYEDEAGGGQEVEVETIQLPRSQLFHFYSPLPWAQLIKLEYEPSPPPSQSGGMDDNDHDENHDEESQQFSFPVRTFIVSLKAERAEVKAEINNEDLKKTMLGVLDIEFSEECHPSFRLNGDLDMTNSERRLELLAVSLRPSTREYSLSSTWSSDLPQICQGKVEVKTPIENLEEQTSTIMYAHNQEEGTFSVDFEFTSLAFEKLSTTVMVGPKTFSMALSTPFEHMHEIEVRGDLRNKDEEGEEAVPLSSLVNAIIVAKCMDKEVEIDVDASMDDEGWPEELNGTISANFGPEGYRHGDVKGKLEKQDEEEVQGQGEILWMNQQRLNSTFSIQLSDHRVKHFNINLRTPFRREAEEWGLALDIESADEKLQLGFTGSTPLQFFETYKGTFIIQYDEEFIPNGVALTASSSNQSYLALNSTWQLTSWNQCALKFDGDYSLPQAMISAYEFNLPPRNKARVEIINKIPTLHAFTTATTKLALETLKPSFKCGLDLGGEYVEGSGQTLLHGAMQYRESPFLPQDSSTSDTNLEELNAQEINATRDTGFFVTSDLQVKEGGEDVGFVLNITEIGLSKNFYSEFNYSRLENKDGQLHLRVFHTNVSNNGGGAGTYEEERNPLIQVDGVFNPTLNRHSLWVKVDEAILSGKSLSLNNSNLHTPSSSISVELMVESLRHFEAGANLSFIPFLKINKGGFIVSNEVDGTTWNGVVGGHVDEDTLQLKYFCDYEVVENFFKVNVSLNAELPASLNTSPENGTVDYFYSSEMEPHPRTESHLKAVYNGVQIVKSSFHSRISKVPGQIKGETILELDNHFYPFGLVKVSQIDGSGSVDNLPTKDVTSLSIYDLRQPDINRLELGVQIKTNLTGKEITLTGSHPNRSVELVTAYAILIDHFRHTTHLVLMPKAVLSYEVDVFNRTNREKMEHEMSFRLTYPIRVITLRSMYKYQNSSLKWKTEVNFNAGKRDRSLVGLVEWDFVDKPRESEASLHKLKVTLEHPAIPKGLVGEATVERDGWCSIAGKVLLDYAGNPSKGLALSITSNNNYEKGLYFPLYWNLTTEGHLVHEPTELEVKSSVSTLNSVHELSIITLIEFKNSEKSVPLESKIAFELFKQLRKTQLMMVDMEGSVVIGGHLEANYPKYVLIGEANVSSFNDEEGALSSYFPSCRVTLDLEKPYLLAHFVEDSEMTSGVYAEGGFVDQRHVKFDVWEKYDTHAFSDVSFALRLNHSRLLTSHLKWRPDLYSEMKDHYFSLREALENLVDSKLTLYKSSLKQTTGQMTKAIWADAKGTIEPFLKQLWEECDFRNDSAALQFFFEEMYTHNEFYVQDILGFTQLFLEECSMRASNMLEAVKEYQEAFISETYETVVETFSWAKTWIKDAYDQLVTAWENYQADPWTSLSSILPFTEIKEKLYLVCYYGIGVFVKLGEVVYRSVSSLLSSVMAELGVWVQRYQPQLLALANQIEIFFYEFFSKVTDLLYETKEEVLRSQYYRKLHQLAEDVDELYREISQNDAVSNIKKFYGLTKTFLARKLSEMDELVLPLGRVGTIILSFWEKVKTSSWVSDSREILLLVWAKTAWLMEYTNLEEKIQDLILLLYSKGSDLFSQTVLQAGARYQTAKTKFIFDADKGIISLEQKLPMSWTAFNETPDFQKLPEYQQLLKWQDFYKASKSWLRNWYYKAPLPLSLASGYAWLPPFDGHAMMVGSKYVLTFDGLSYKLGGFSGSCNYVLVADLVDGNFSISLQVQAGEDDPPPNIIVSVGHNTLVFDMKNHGLRDPKRGNQFLHLPTQSSNLRGFQEGENLVVQSWRGLSVSCNLVHPICQFHVSGWYSRKVGGLLGTMDEEKSTDLTLNSGKRTNSLNELITAWQFSDEATEESCERIEGESRFIGGQSTTTLSIGTLKPESKHGSICHKIFHGTTSSLEPCFKVVRTDPFYDMCLVGGSSTEDRNSSSSTPCTSVIAYITSCRMSGVIVKPPSLCVKCEMNGDEMMDRDMKVISSPPPGSPSFLSTDVVFIVEAKECNRVLRRRIDTLTKNLEEELRRSSFRQNRYAVILFGGDGVYDEPRAVVENKNIFTNASNVGRTISNLHSGNGSIDIFNGIWYTLQHLNFRPGVSKTLILFPCSPCQPQDMKMEYSDMYYAMREKGATLHILMDSPFFVERRNLAKKVFGVDEVEVFTKADALEGNQPSKSSALRRQIKILKRTLGHCAPLALQTNGSIFNLRKLQGKQEALVPLFSSAFGKRVAKTAVPSSCQTCFCSASTTGFGGRIECFECGYPKYEPRQEDSEEDESRENELINRTSSVDNLDGDEDNTSETEEEE